MNTSIQFKDSTQINVGDLSICFIDWRGNVIEKVHPFVFLSPRPNVKVVNEKAIFIDNSHIYIIDKCGKIERHYVGACELHSCRYDQKFDEYEVLLKYNEVFQYLRTTNRGQVWEYRG